MNCLSRILVIIACGLLLTGCGKNLSGGADVQHATAVSSSEFSESMKGRIFFLIGSDPPVHYVVSDNGFYRLTDNEQLIQHKLRTHKPGDEGFGESGIFMKLEGERAVKCEGSPDLLAALETYLGPRKSTQ